jgi:hypothetical protein
VAVGEHQTVGRDEHARARAAALTGLPSPEVLHRALSGGCQGMGR